MAERNIVPNLEAKATDGNPVITPRQWLESFRPFCKRDTYEKKNKKNKSPEALISTNEKDIKKRNQYKEWNDSD